MGCLGVVDGGDEGGGGGGWVGFGGVGFGGVSLEGGVTGGYCPGEVMKLFR